MLRFNLRLALRNLKKNKVYSVLIIGGFAIGFSASILIGLYYHTEQTVNKGFANYTKIFRLYDVKNNRANLNWDLFPVLVQDFAEVKDACPMEYVTGMVTTLKNEQTHANTQIQHLLTTTNNFFSIFSVEMVERLSDKPFDRKESVVLSKSVAKKLFGTKSPLGQQVNINNFFSGTVTGIFNDLPANSSFQADIILNSENEKYRLSSTIVNERRYNPTNLFLLLKEGTSMNEFTAKMNRTIGSYQLDVDSVGVQNLADLYLTNLSMKSKHAKGNPGMLMIFLAIAVLIVVLSSINYLNYSISMQYAKLKDIGIYKTNGAGWRDLVNYSFTEVTLGILISLVISILITMLALPYSQYLFGKPLHITSSDLMVLAPVFLGIIAVIILINSLGPMYVLSRFKITEFLSGFDGKRNKRQFGKQVMLLFQLVTSIALIAVVLVIFKQINFVKHSELGFDRESLLRIDLPYQFKYSDAFKQETAKRSFVKSSTLSLGCPGMINMRIGSNTGENSFTLNCIYVDKEYLKTMGIELLRGRTFEEGDINRACLMNEEAIKKYEWDTYEGKKFLDGGESGFEVVGIVKDFKVKPYYYGVEPLALLCSDNPNVNILSVKLAAGNTDQQLDQLKNLWKNFEPYEPMIISFYDADFQAMYAKEEQLERSVTFFAIIAIVLTCMGILGQIFMSSLHRVKEIGIRKVNGAKIAEIMLLLNKDFIKWILIAFIIATPIAYYTMNKWLDGFAYKTALSWWLFALAGLLALAIALITVSWQSWRAATRNPVEALKSE